MVAGTGGPVSIANFRGEEHAGTVAVAVTIAGLFIFFAQSPADVLGTAIILLRPKAEI